MSTEIRELVEAIVEMREVRAWTMAMLDHYAEEAACRLLCGYPFPDDLATKRRELAESIGYMSVMLEGESIYRTDADSVHRMISLAKEALIDSRPQGKTTTCIN